MSEDKKKKNIKLLAYALFSLTVLFLAVFLAVTFVVSVGNLGETLRVALPIWAIVAVAAGAIFALYYFVIAPRQK